jgi:hypothetical protein
MIAKVVSHGELGRSTITRSRANERRTTSECVYFDRLVAAGIKNALLVAVSELLALTTELH